MTHLAALLHFMHSPILEQALLWRYVSSAICWEPVQAHAEEDLKISTSLQGDASHWGQPQPMLALQPALQNRNGHPPARMQETCSTHCSPSPGNASSTEDVSIGPHRAALLCGIPSLIFPWVSGIRELINPASAGFTSALNWTAPALHGLLS